MDNFNAQNVLSRLAEKCPAASECNILSSNPNLFIINCPSPAIVKEVAQNAYDLARLLQPLDIRMVEIHCREVLIHQFSVNLALNYHDWEKLEGSVS